MTDIKMVFEPTEQAFDLNIVDGDLVMDQGVETPTHVSLFTDHRASEDDDLPGAQNDRRGWWGALAVIGEPVQVGSKLWLLERAKITSISLAFVEDFARDALKWMIDEGLAMAVDIEVTRLSADKVALQIVITRRNGAREGVAYDNLWRSINAA